MAGRCGNPSATAYLLQQLLCRRHPTVLPEIVDAIAAFFVGPGPLENDDTTLEFHTRDALDADDLALVQYHLGFAWGE